MKNKCLYIVSVLTLALAACSREYHNTEFLTEDTMSFDIVSPYARSTRVSDGAFENSDRLGLYVTDYADTATPAPLQISGNRANNEALEFDGALWTALRPVRWGEGKADVYAYYPYMEITDVDEQPFSVALDQNDGKNYEISDFLWAKAEGVAQTDGPVSLHLKHAMSRLVVRIMAGEDYIGSLPAEAAVHLHSTVTDARVSLANGSVVKYPYGAAHSIRMRSLGLRSFADGEALVYEAIVVPQMLETSVPLLEINSKSVSYLLEDMFNFKPGVSYTYTAVLNTSTTAIRIDIGCSTDDWNNLGSGTGGGDEGPGGGDDGVDLSQYTDLSADGTANCYLVSAAGNYKFKAVKGNSDDTVGNVGKTEVLWESFGTDVKPNVGDIVASAGYKDGYVYFSTPESFAGGNASIAVRNSKDVILWSWHIWCSAEGWNDQIYANEAGIMMDRNLGALSAVPGDAGAFGLLYQWGRKDPFMGACAKSGTALAASSGSWTTISGSKTVDFAEENPMAFISDSDWCSQTWNNYGIRWKESEKTLYDPCPASYRVPDGGAGGFWDVSKVNVTFDSSNRGIYWELSDGSSAWYPAIGYRVYSSGALGSVGDYGYCWSASPYSGTTYHAYTLYFYYSGNVTPANTNYRGNGYSVRCVRE